MIMSRKAPGYVVPVGAKKVVEITPDDSTDLPGGVTIGVYVGVEGDVKVVLEQGSVVLFKGLASGVVHHLAVKRVFSTGTTATDILALY